MTLCHIIQIILNLWGDIMRICDICFCELTEDGTCEIKDGVRKDFCAECLKLINTKLTDENGEELINEHIRLLDKKDENIENLILKIRKESRNKYSRTIY